MKYISEKDYICQMKRIKAKKKKKKRINALNAEKRKMYPKLKLPSTSKLILAGVIFICFEIVIFCEYAIIRLSDTSAMYALVGIPATLIPIVLGYYNKAKAENTQGGIVYDMTMMQKEQENTEDSEDVSD